MTVSTPGNVGRLSAELRLDGADQFQAELNRVGDNLQRTKGKGEAFGSAVASGVKKAAGVTADLTAAAGAYLTILTATGVSYNSLQQNSRAALSTMLGGAVAANEQMDKLDAFAKKSPFSKQVFINAQQQMLAFGIEAKNVIPYLDALQNAVAASGGSNDDLAGLVEIFAKIKSSAKITAEDLNQFGGRGVDAATLIGASMGKTGAEIRDEITKGTLDAQVALDALAAGMTDRFGGATDLIKQQWSGAVDRIKSANRDIGAAIAEPFVSKNGGGLAVQWANQIADVLRAVEKQTVPVMEILMRTGAGFFAELGIGLDSAAQSVERFNPQNIEKFFAAVKQNAPAVGAAVGLIAALGTKAGVLGTVFSTLGISANPVLAVLAGIAATSPEVRDALGDLVDAGKPLLPVVADIAEVLSGMLSAALPIVADGLTLVASVARPLIELLSQIPTPLLLGVAGFLALHKWLAPTAGGIKSVADAFKGFAENATLQAALGDTSVGMGALATGSMKAQDGVKKLGGALKTAFLSNPIGIALTVISAAVGVWAAANAAAEQKVAEHRDRVSSLQGTLDQTNGSLSKATREQIAKNLADTNAAKLADEMGIAYRDVEDAILGDERALRKVNEAMDAHIAATTTGDENLDSWSATATNAKNRVAELTPIIDEQARAVTDAQQAVRDKVQADRDAAAAMTEAERSNSRLNEAIKIARDVTQDATSRITALKQALDELKGGAISTEEAQKRLSATNLTLAEGFAQTDEKGVKLWQSTLDGVGAIDLSSRQGLALADAMGASRDAMLQAAMAASDAALANGDYAGAVTAATSAGDAYIETLRGTMQQAGLTAPQIDGLIGKYLDVPGVVSTILTDNGTIDATDQKVLMLTAKLNGIPEGESIIIDEPLSPQVMARLDQLKVKTETLPDGKIRITSQGEDHVEGVLRRLTQPRSVVLNIRETSSGQQYAQTGNGKMFKNGGIETHAFASGGLPSGFYSAPSGRDAIYKFAEKELPWEVFISPQPGQERANVGYALEALRRLGSPSIPLSELNGNFRAFRDGGIAEANSTALSRHPAPTGAGWNMTIINPVVRDPFQQAWEQVEEKGGL